MEWPEEDKQELKEQLETEELESRRPSFEEGDSLKQLERDSKAEQIWPIEEADSGLENGEDRREMGVV